MRCRKGEFGFVRNINLIKIQESKQGKVSYTNTLHLFANVTIKPEHCRALNLQLIVASSLLLWELLSIVHPHT